MRGADRPRRSDYTTADTVADIEAIRQAGGYEKLVLYGTSYGTKVAERYAQTYPSHVSALVLDSVVPPNGPGTAGPADVRGDPARAAPAVRGARVRAHHPRTGCGPRRGSCRRIARVAPLSGRCIDGDGHAHTLRVSASSLLDVLLAGDLEPVLRAEFPAAVRAAAEGDTRRSRAWRRDASASGAKAAKKKPRARASTRPCTTRPPAKRSCFP